MPSRTAYTVALLFTATAIRIVGRQSHGHENVPAVPSWPFAVLASLLVYALMVTCGALLVLAWSRGARKACFQGHDQQVGPTSDMPASQPCDGSNQAAHAVQQDAKQGFLETIASLTGTSRTSRRSSFSSMKHAKQRDMLAIAMRMGQHGYKQSSLQVQKHKNSIDVLWVCKEEEVLHLHRILPASRYRILTAHKQQQLLDMLHQQPTLPDVLLMDLDDSWEACEAMLEAVRVQYSSAELPILAILDVSLPKEAAIKALTNGANDSITKPLQAAELDARIMNQVQLYSQHVLRGEAATFLHILNRTVPGPIIQRTMARAQLPNATTITIAQQLPEVTVLHLGIHNFTTLNTRWSTQHAVAVINELMNPFEEILDRYGCFKAGQTGGTYTALAGHDGAPDHTVRIMHVARSILAHSLNTACGERLQVSIGIHTGPVHCGLVGTVMPQFTLFGDTVNTAQLLQTVATPGCAFLSAAAQQLLKEQQAVPEFSCVDLGTWQLPEVGAMSVFVAKVCEWDAAVRSAGSMAVPSPPKSRASTMDGYAGPASRGFKKIASYNGGSSTPRLRSPSQESPAQDATRQFELYNIPDLKEPFAVPHNFANPPSEGIDTDTQPYLPVPPKVTAGMQRSATASPAPADIATMGRRAGRSLDSVPSSRISPPQPSASKPLSSVASYDGRDSLAVIRAAGVVLETCQSEISSPGSHQLGNRAQGEGLAQRLQPTGVAVEHNQPGNMLQQDVKPTTTPAHMNAGAGSSGTGGSVLQPVQLGNPVYGWGHIIARGISKQDSGLNSASLTRSGSSNEHTLGAHLLAHQSTSSGITLPMSSDSSLYRVPWLEQYLGSSTYIPTMNSLHAYGSNRCDSDDLLQRHTGSADHPNHILVYDRRSTNNQLESSQPLEATSNNILVDSNRTSCGLASSTLAALHASLVASMRAATSSQGSAAALAQLSEALIALAQGTCSSSGKLSTITDLNIFSSLAAGSHPLITTTDADGGSVRSTPDPALISAAIPAVGSKESSTSNASTDSNAVNAAVDVLNALLTRLTPEQRTALVQGLHASAVQVTSVQCQGGKDSHKDYSPVDERSSHIAAETSMASMSGLAHGGRLGHEDPALTFLSRNRASLTSNNAHSVSMSFPQLQGNIDSMTVPLTGAFGPHSQSCDIDQEISLAGESAGLVLLGLATLSNGQASDFAMSPEMRRVLDAMRSQSDSRSGQIPNTIQSLQQLITALNSVTNTGSGTLPPSRLSLTGLPNRSTKGPHSELSASGSSYPGQRLMSEPSNSGDTLNDMSGTDGGPASVKGRLVAAVKKTQARRASASSGSSKASDSTLPMIGEGTMLDSRGSVNLGLLLASHPSGSGHTAGDAGKEAGSFLTQVVEKLSRRTHKGKRSDAPAVTPRARSAFNFREVGSKGSISLKERNEMNDAGSCSMIDGSEGQIPAGVDERVSRVRWSLTEPPSTEGSKPGYASTEMSGQGEEATVRRKAAKRQSSFKKLASGLRKAFSSNARSPVTADVDALVAAADRHT